MGLIGVDDELGHKAEQKHEADDGRKRHALAVMQIGKAGPVLRHGAGEDLLNHGENHGRRDEQAKHRNRCADPGQAEKRRGR